MVKKITASISIDEKLKDLIITSDSFKNDGLSGRIEEALYKALQMGNNIMFVSNKANMNNTQKGTIYSAGIDIRLLEKIEIKPGFNVIDLKTSFEIPKGHFGMLKLRSSIAKRGIFEYSGIIDSDYRGECKLLVFNLMNDSFLFEAGERIAQMVIIPFADPKIEFKETLTESEREGGFGSTGV